jgi:hypothetical protein
MKVETIRKLIASDLIDFYDFLDNRRLVYSKASLSIPIGLLLELSTL